MFQRQDSVSRLQVEPTEMDLIERASSDSKHLQQKANTTQTTKIDLTFYTLNLHVHGA
jgi:hypothetical protein